MRCVLIHVHDCISQIWPLIKLKQSHWPQIQFCSVQSCQTLCNPTDCTMPGFPVLHHLPELVQTHVHRVAWCHPTTSSSVIPLSTCLQSFPASGSSQRRQFFTSGGQSIGTSALASVLPMNIQDWLISFTNDWLNLLAIQGTLKSLLQHHSSKTLVLRHSAFFIVQLSHPYLTTGNTIALTTKTFVGKVMSPLFNMLSRLIIAFPPRRKCLLISWLQSQSAMILEPPQIKSATVSIVSLSIYHEGWDQMPWS